MKNKLKVYLRTKANIEEQANLYENIFLGKIIGKNINAIKDWTFANLLILNDINILITKYNDSFPKFGYSSDIILTIVKDEDFTKIYKSMLESKKFKMDYGVQIFEPGNIKITKFIDVYGYSWILEKKI